MGINFNGYITIDPAGKLTISIDGSRITITNQTLFDTNYVYFDYGIDFWDGDFSYPFTIQANSVTTSGAAPFSPAVFSNVLDSIYNSTTGGWLPSSIHVLQECGSSFYNITCRSFNASRVQDGFDFSHGGYVNTTPYYPEFRRVGATVYVDIYSDPGRSVWEDTLSMTPGSVIKFRYHFGFSGYRIGISGNIIHDAFIEDGDLGFHEIIQTTPRHKLRKDNASRILTFDDERRKLRSDTGRRKLIT